jgi:hypothetical protein
MYRPTEDISIKGYIRRTKLLNTQETLEIPKDIQALKYQFRDSRSNQISNGEVSLNAVFGTFHLQLKAPEDINLGNASITFEGKIGTLSSKHTHHFTVQEVILTYKLCLQR